MKLAVFAAGLILPLLAINLTPSAHAQCTPGWQTGGASGGLNGFGLALTVYNGNLVVGGSFTSAGGVSASNVAMWNGTAWQPLGSGLGGMVFALTVYNGQLIAGGQFSGCIAAWNPGAPGSWQSLGSGIGGSLPHYSTDVRALAVYNGKLIAGGAFTTAGGVGANCIAAWDGASWQPLGSGISGPEYHNGPVFALTVYNGQLIAGGSFSTAGGISANCIAAWDGACWQPLGAGTNRSVFALTVYNGSLIAAGGSTPMGGAQVLAWNGISWQTLGTGMDFDINALAVYHGQLIAGGFFYTVPGTNASFLAAWNGVSWHALKNNTEPLPDVNSSVSALAVYNGQLIAGGAFTTAGGNDSPFLARWQGCPPAGADFNGDGHVDDKDFAGFTACATGPGITYNPLALPSGCAQTADTQNHIAADFNRDGIVDLDDFSVFQRCYSGLAAADPDCVN